MKTHYIAAAAALESVLAGKRVAVVFCSGFKERARATQRLNEKQGREVVVTIGPLNYEERQYVKLCRKHGTNPRRFWFPGEGKRQEKATKKTKSSKKRN